MATVLKKLLFKGQKPVLLLDVPAELALLAKELGTVHRKPNGKYGFALAFAKSMSDADTHAKTLKASIDDDALVWVAYPKGTSKKYKGADINRDTLHARMGKLGLVGVSLVALDDDWSAMRFKPK